MLYIDVEEIATLLNNVQLKINFCSNSEEISQFSYFESERVLI